MDRTDAFSPRLVVTGVDAVGKSVFVHDGPSEFRQATPALTMVPMWQVDALPSPVLVDTGRINIEGFMPPQAGFRMVMVEMPPDEDVGDDAERNLALAEILDNVGASEALRTDQHPVGFHQTETAEMIVILSGEVITILEDGEKLLRAGDTLVQRGTIHAWANRSGSPCRFLFVVWPIKR